MLKKESEGFKLDALNMKDDAMDRGLHKKPPGKNNPRTRKQLAKMAKKKER